MEYDQFEKKMLADRPFNLVLKYKKVLERYYNRMQVKFNGEMPLNDDKELLFDAVNKIGLP